MGHARLLPHPLNHLLPRHRLSHRQDHLPVARLRLPPRPRPPQESVTQQQSGSVDPSVLFVANAVAIRTARVTLSAATSAATKAASHRIALRVNAIQQPRRSVARNASIIRVVALMRNARPNAVSAVARKDTLSRRQQMHISRRRKDVNICTV